MRIAFFHNLPTGGAKRVVYEQIKYLAQKHEIDLYYIQTGEQQLFSADKFAHQVFTYPFNINNRAGMLNRIIRDYQNFILLKILQKKIAKDIDQQEYDCVIVHPDRYTQTPFILRFLQTPNLYFCEEWLRIAYEPEYFFKDDVQVFKKIYEQLTRIIRKKVDYMNMQSAKHVVANSAFTASNIAKAYGKKAIIALLGVNTKLYRPTKTKKEYDVLFIGEKVSQEGYTLLEDAQKKIKGKVSIKILSRKNNKLTRTDEDMVQEYNKAKLVLALSFNEPFGLIPLEAMACAVPVIALDEGGYKETIKNNKTGYLIPRDPKLLAEKIKYLIENEGRRQIMSKTGREETKKNWTWENHGKKLEEYIYRYNK